jgi:hypothetical protein
MARRVFISYEGEDRNQAKGFNLLRWNKNVDVEFVGRHLLDPVKSKDSDYIRGEIKERIKGTSVTVIICGAHTNESEWVQKEIEWSLAKDLPNGLLAIKLTNDAQVPEALVDCGADIIGWNPNDFADAIERAALQAGRVKALLQRGGGSGHGCVRS